MPKKEEEKKVNKKSLSKVKKGYKKQSKKEGKKESVVEKQKKQEEEKDERIVYAHEKYIPISAQKARLVVDLIREQNALEAVSKLRFLKKKAALVIKKAIESAVANAVHNFEMDKKRLVIVEAFVDEAPTFKRGRAGSRGRYKKILKRNCHITIGVCQADN
jgi:large subunit ribosomal protein L22